MPKYGFFSGPYFPSFGPNTERYFVSLRIQSKCRKIWTIKNFVFGHFSRSVLLYTQVIAILYFLSLFIFLYVKPDLLILVSGKSENFVKSLSVSMFRGETFCSLLFTFCSLLVSFCLLLVSFCSLLVSFARCSLLFALYSLLVTFCSSLLVTFCSLLITFCPLLVIFCSLLDKKF